MTSTPWNPTTAARARNLNLGEDVGNLYQRYGIDPTRADADRQLEAIQRYGIPLELQHHLERWEMPAASELEAMHKVGVCVDRDKAAKLVAALSDMVADLKGRLVKQGIEKPGDDAHIRRWLLKSHLPINGKDQKMDDHLKEIEGRDPKGDEDPILQVPIIRRYRRLHALRDQHPWLLAEDERIQPHHYHLCQTTGRTTTKEPAVTGIPKEVRPVITATPGYELFEIDYVSMEVGVAAGLSGDERLLAAYRTGDAIGDIARIIFPEIANVPVADVKRSFKPLRDQAKPIVYGTLYGQTPYGLALRTGMSEANAQALQDRLFGTCTSFKAMVEASKRHVAATRTVILGCGFERYIPDHEPDYRLKTIAANAPIQAGAGIIFRMASVLAGPRLSAIGARLILPIHDAYVCEVPVGLRERAITILARAMEVASLVFFRGRLRLDVDVNDDDVRCWNKDGNGDSLERLIDNPAYRIP
jgi:DNA polymerase-1